MKIYFIFARAINENAIKIHLLKGMTNELIYCCRGMVLFRRLFSETVNFSLAKNTVAPLGAAGAMRIFSPRASERAELECGGCQVEKKCVPGGLPDKAAS